MKYKRLIIEKVKPKETVDEIVVDEDKLISITAIGLEMRTGGNVANKAIFLPYRIGSEPVDWIIIKDNVGQLCAVPLRKELD